MSSKKSNVNPDHYKTAGRSPQGQDVVQKVYRQRQREQEALIERTAPKGPTEKEESGGETKKGD